ncbi:hypothetical protein [Paracoccus shandongensis]|uniref:hypothetical protein n=1 Tax=Paracoccus shandongensis TaxID=2816048 RepID=UPI001A8D645C|nr:hypothetical protein [Paracoccus shandongensis]
MMHDDETAAETSIRRTIRLSCEGLGLALAEADAIAGRAIGTLRARRAGGHGAGAAAPIRLGVQREAGPETTPCPSEARNDGALIDHLVARWRNA